MGRDADDHVRPDNLPRLGERQIVLAEVQAIRFGQPRYVRAIIDEKQRLPGAQPPRFPGQPKELAGPRIFQPQLNDGCAAADESAHQVEHRAARRPVGYRVNSVRQRGHEACTIAQRCAISRRPL